MGISSLTSLVTTCTAQSVAICTGPLIFTSGFFSQYTSFAKPPHLYLMMKGTSHDLSLDRVLTMTSHIVAIAHHSLALNHSLQELKFSWNKINSLELLPTPSNILFTSLEKNTSSPLIALTIRIERLRLLLYYSSQAFWNLCMALCKMVSLINTLLWSEAKAQCSQEQVLYNLKECGKILFEKEEGDWTDLCQTIESSTEEILTSLGAHQISPMILATLKSGLQGIEHLYHTLNNTPTFWSLLNDGIKNIHHLFWSIFGYK